MSICDICTQEVSTEDDMRSHMALTHEDQEFSCPLCTIAGLTYDELSFHIHTAHEDMLEAWIDLENQCDVVSPADATDIPSADISYSGIHTTDSICDNRLPIQTKLSKDSPGNAQSEMFFCEGSFANSSTAVKAASVVNAMRFSPVVYTPGSEMSDEHTVEHGLVASAAVAKCDMDVPPECPFCCDVKSTVEELEFHVRTEHADLLDTPTKGDCKQYECPICSLVCTSSGILEEHVNLHLEEDAIHKGASAKVSSDLQFARQLQTEEDQHRRAEESLKEKEEFQKLQRQFGMDNSGGYREQSLQNLEKAVARGRMQPMDFHLRKAQMMETLATGIDDGRTKTSGVLEVLRRYYQSSAPEVNRVWLCSYLDHFSNSLGDKGWGCGFRNFQMLLSSLLTNDSYKNTLQGYRSIPCIPKIQLMIEDSWKEGFDPHGASHFNGKLHGTKAWIGACEIYCVLTSLRLKSRIIDFHKPSSPSGTHPFLFDWVLNYYSSDASASSDRVLCTSKPAIYLQHQGHSRTIVGIEERKNKSYCLLLFDPGHPFENMRKLKHNIDSAALKPLRKFPGSLKHKQYQIVAVEGILSAEEKAVCLQMTKTFKAERIP